MSDSTNTTPVAGETDAKVSKHSGGLHSGNKKRFVATIHPDDLKAIKVLMAELGIDEAGGGSSERNGRLLSLMIAILGAEMEMARVSSNKRFVDEKTIKDYIQRKYDQEVRNVRAAPLFD